MLLLSRRAPREGARGAAAEVSKGGGGGAGAPAAAVLAHHNRRSLPATSGCTSCASRRPGHGRRPLLPLVRAAAPFTGGGPTGGGSGGAAAVAAAPAPPPAAAAAAAASTDPQQHPEQQQQHELPVVHVPFRWPAQLSSRVSAVSVFGSWDGWRQRVPLARSPVTGDFVRALALALDPLGVDGAGAAVGARQIEYKFVVEYEDEVTGEEGEDGEEMEQERSGGDGNGDGDGRRPARRTRTRVAVRPCPSDPVIRTAAPVFASEVSGGGGQGGQSHANNKRLLAPNKLFVLPAGPGGASPQDEVLAVTDYGGWHAAIPLAWNHSAGRHEAAAALPAGAALSYRLLVNGRPVAGGAGALLQPPLAPAPPPAPAGRLAHRDAALPPPRAFTLFYATGWPSATLVYRFRLPARGRRLVAAAGAAGNGGGAVTPWQELPMDVAPSRDAPDGGGWMTAVVEPPPALRRDPWALAQRAAAAEQEEEHEEEGGGFSSSSQGSSAAATATIASRVAALAAAPSPPCELEFFVRGPPIAPPPPTPASTANDGSSNAALAAPCPRHPEEDRGPGGDGRRHYVLPAPMAWKLRRGHVRKFPRAIRPPVMLVSDLDHTLFAEGEQAAQALGRFTHYWESEAALARSVLVYNTGRSLGQFVSLVNEQAGRLALPDVLVTAVGTKVFHLKAEWRGGKVGGAGGNGGSGGMGGSSSSYSSSYSSSSAAHAAVTEDDWQEDLAWARRLDHGWDLTRARAVAERAIVGARERFSRGFGGGAGEDGGGGGGGYHQQQYLPGDQIVNWLDDGSEHPHRVAVSCHVRATPFVVAALRSGMAASGVRARVIVSGAGEWRYVDAVARRAGKAAALEHVRRLYGVQPERTMAAGDSCNDVLMLAAAADGGMAEALAAPLAQAAMAAQQAQQQQQGRDDDDLSAATTTATTTAAAMLMMRGYWAGGGARSFLDEASDLSSGGGGGSSSGGGINLFGPHAVDGDKEEEEEEDGDGGRAPRVRAVIVGNAQRELVEWYHQGLAGGDTGAASILLARQPLADGVLEGLMRHGLY